MKIVINIDDKLIDGIKAFFKRRSLISAFVIIFVLSIVIIHAADIELVVFQPDTPIKSSEINENFSKLRDLINSSTPAGTVIAFAGKLDKIPAGWLLCDGSAIDRNTYSSLFDVIATSWGEGDGTTTFNIPDLRGRFLRGVDAGAGVDIDSAGRTARVSGGNIGDNVGSYQGDAIRNITGFANSFGTSHSGGTTGAFQSAAVAHGSGWDNTGGSETFYHLFFDASKADGVKVGSDNRPKNAYVYYIIKVD